MTALRYKTLRLLCGTQGEVAAKLGVHRVTVAKREAGTLAIAEEAALAILFLAGAGRKKPQAARPDPKAATHLIPRSRPKL